MGFLLKAEKLYSIIVELLQQTKTTCYNQVDVYNLKLNEYNAFVKENPEKAEEVMKPIFRFYY